MKEKDDFITYESRLFGNKNWRFLSGPAKIFYECLKGRYNGENNGTLQVFYSEMKGVKGCASSGSVTNAINELIDEGWIKLERKGGMHRALNYFSLTFRHDHWDDEWK